MRKYCVSPEMHMPNRTAKFVSAIFASILAGAPLTTISHSATVAADDCLSGPKGQTPAGQPLVLSHRARHQTPLLVSPRGGRQAFANRRLRTLRHRRSRLRRKQKRRCNSRSPTPTPNCPRSRYRNRRRRTPARAGECSGIERCPARECCGRERAVIRRRFALARTVGRRASASVPRPATGNAGGKHAGKCRQPHRRPWLPPVTARRRGYVIAKPARLDPDAAGRRCRRAGARRHLPQASSSNSAARDAASRVRARRRPIWESTDDDRIALSDRRGAHALPRRTRFSRGFGEAERPERQDCGIFLADIRTSANVTPGYFSSCRCSSRTNVVKPVRRSRLSRSAFRIDCTSANASSMS